MADLQKTRTLFAFTSPRSIEKIIPEIRLLAENFAGREWNTQTQTEFFQLLGASEFYEGVKMPSNVPLAARDRINRAPKALGFIDLKPVIKLTDVGARLIGGKRIDETITRQLLKFQLPSPYHRTNEAFFVKPYLEFLHLLKAVDSLSKSEIALFFTQLTHIDKFDMVVEMIKTFRVNAQTYKGRRKSYVSACFVEQIKQVFAEEISKRDFKTRESPELTLHKFIRTKQGNLIDYADVFIRYMRATQLITFDSQSYRVVIAPSKIAEVEYILQNARREPLNFQNEDEFKHYLFSSDNVELLSDKRAFLAERLSLLQVSYVPTSDLESLKDLVTQAEERAKEEYIFETQVTLKHFRAFEDIVDVFYKIEKREIPDPPLYFEWNIWRAMVMLNYAINVKGNFTFDLDGVPFHTARGNLPDIEIEYEDFKLIVEVTTSTGNKQYEMEGEPVARHFGNVQNSTIKPVFCLFIAPKISQGALAHFLNLNRFNTKAYGGKTRIIPLTTSQFILFISVARDKGFNHSKQLFDYLRFLVEQNVVVEDEEIWYQTIHGSLANWIGWEN